MCILMGTILAVFWNSFGVKNAEISFECDFFMKMKCKNGSTRLEKHKAIEILLRVDFFTHL